jgi:predicted glycoside hydrolase/deacetylase ChbG (UPF0249 family)
VFASERILIVNADDFGHSVEVNAGVIRAHEHGIVTSTSLMVRRPAVDEAVAYAHSRAAARGWPPRRFGAGEVGGSGRALVALVGRDPTHLDSHKHVHLREPVRSAVAEAGQRLGVPVRHLDPRVRYFGGFYGEPVITVENLCAIVGSLEDGITELGCHPAVGAVPGSSYSTEREQELATLCDPRVREALADAGVERKSFADVS